MKAKKIDNGGKIAMFYGFDVINSPKIQKIKNTPEGCCDLASLISHYKENWEKSPKPILAYYRKPISGSRQKKIAGEFVAELAIIGSSSPIVEIQLIQTAYAILKEEGFKNLQLNMNSLGDKESINKFEKELVNYYRKNINDLSARCRQNFKKEIFNIPTSTDTSCSDFIEGAPNSIGCLTDPSRKRFREVLEYAESLEMPYEIEKSVIKNPECYSQTVFEILDTKKNKVLASGGYVTSLAKKLKICKEVPVAHITIQYKKSDNKMNKKAVQPKSKKNIFFIQVGQDAKKKSSEILETLRKKGIFVNHSLTKDRCTVQLAMAEKQKSDYLLIVGQTEAMENCVVVRDAVSRNQESVAINVLPSYLNKLK